MPATADGAGVADAARIAARSVRMVGEVPAPDVVVVGSADADLVVPAERLPAAGQTFLGGDPPRGPGRRSGHHAVGRAAGHANPRRGGSGMTPRSADGTGPRSEPLGPLAGVERLYVDAMNVIGSRPDGWWRDRDGAVRRLAARLQAFAVQRDTEVVLVIDGAPVPGLPEGRDGAVLVRYARRAGPDAADDRLVELLGAADPGGGHASDVSPGATVVVTADRELRARVSALGASVVGPRRLLTTLDGPSAPVD